MLLVATTISHPATVIMHCRLHCSLDREEVFDMVINWLEIIIELAGDMGEMTIDRTQVSLSQENCLTCNAC